MTLFVDSANLGDIEKAISWGVCRGVTTNPKIAAGSGVKYSPEAYRDNIRRICELVNGPVSVELTNTMGLVPELVREAAELYNIDRGKVVVKVPMWGSGKGLEVIHDLAVLGVPTNATCLMNAAQGILAAETGAKYVSLFYRRMRDYYGQFQEEFDHVAAEFGDLSRYLCGKDCELIAGSIRELRDVVDCFTLGTDIVTVPPKILWELPKHPKTEATIAEFDEAWRKYTHG